MLEKYPRRVVHNSMLIQFAVSVLPPDKPDALVCTRAAVWALPEVASALYVAQFTESSITNAVSRVSICPGSVRLESLTPLNVRIGREVVKAC